MRNHMSHIGAAVLIGAIGVACSGRTDRVDNPRLAQSGAERGTYQNVKLSGCLQAAPGTNAYVLNQAAMAPAAEQPAGTEAVEHPIVLEGSWARLTAGSNDLKGYLGQRVEVIGTVQDRGTNTIGTSGKTGDLHDKFARSSRDSGSNPDRAMPPSTVAPGSADANGMAPLIAVERISRIGGRCE